MTAEEYFGDWMEVIDKEELMKVMRWLKTFDKSLLRPDYPNIFKAFRACPFSKCKVVILGQDPYPQPGVATGILFGNSKETSESDLSPSLKVIKNALPLPSEGEYFDNTMEHWATQGILMINSALTCQTEVIGSHVAIWRPFVSSLLRNISLKNEKVCMVLFGRQAQSFSKFIDNTLVKIQVEHPAYFARKGEQMPKSIFVDINKSLESLGEDPIKFYK